jgi:hypothetical protein
MGKAKRLEKGQKEVGKAEKSLNKAQKEGGKDKKECNKAEMALRRTKKLQQDQKGFKKGQKYMERPKRF